MRDISQVEGKTQECAYVLPERWNGLAMEENAAHTLTNSITIRVNKKVFDNLKQFQAVRHYPTMSAAAGRLIESALCSYGFKTRE